MEIRVETAGVQWEGVHVRVLSGREAISQVFSFDLDVVCDPQLDLPEDAVPGARLSVVFLVEGEEIRRIHGILEQILDRLDPADELGAYRLRVVPRLFKLALVETQEIYMDVSVPDVIRRKLERHGLGAGDFELRLLRAYPLRELVVQYKESDLAFISRLAEHLGISFTFEHRVDRDVVVFTDHPAGFRPAEGAAEAQFRPRGEASDVFALEVTRRIIPSAYVVHDYNYRRPLLDIAAYHTLDGASGGGIVEFGSHVKTAEEAKELAQIRAEERLSGQRVYEGKSALPAFTAGHRTLLREHPRFEAPEDLLLVEVEHAARLPAFHEAGVQASYANTFTAVPGSVSYRPPRRTPRPRIHGFVTGVVQPGPGGESGGVARLDGDGRYTVQFHFDTALPGEQKSSHPVRMAQPFAGPNHNMHFPLRPGAEVLLVFADGDPDRPLIVGSVPNAAAPSAVNTASADRHRITTATGAMIEIRDRR
ncbi:type VI secretion system tip protein TssI/VgrG [Sorangium sp. So ce448]|uniref:type VI secretion system Vgr family protein n=1 Tax=Sorangium sp. So ce448 TaxID=3133314 RepID=UPI003F610ABA